MTEAERLEKRHERRLKQLERLHTSLRTPGSFASRERTAKDFWRAKDIGRDVRFTEEGKTHPLDGWLRTLRQWLDCHEYPKPVTEEGTPKFVTPQVADILTIAAECKNWPDADKAEIAVLAQRAQRCVLDRYKRVTAAKG